MDALSKVETALHSYCSDKITAATTVDVRYAELWQEIDQYLMNGGKRMRPRLVLLAHDAYKKSGDSSDITQVAAAWELLHACLLIHDDIIDRDLIRHGLPNLAGRYQSIYDKLSSVSTEHYALSAALLGGDLLLMGSYEMVNTAAISSDMKLLVHSYLNQALFTVAGGELIDTDSALYPVAQSNPLAVAHYKTASYSLQLPLQCGAALAGAPDEELEKLSRLGLHAGIAYQLRDDILGIAGDSATTGKSNRSDIFEKKRTFLIHKTLEKLDSTQAARLAGFLAPDHTVTDQQAEEIVGLIVSSGAIEATEQTIRTEISEALRVIDTLRISSSFKEEFRGIATKLITRAS